MKKALSGIVVALVLAGCAPSVTVVEHEAALAAVETQRSALADQIGDLNGDIDDLTGQITDLQARVDLAEKRLVERDDTITELEGELTSLRRERDEAVVQASELLLAFDADIQAARARLQSDLLAAVCVAVSGDSPPASAARFVEAYLATSPEAAAALSGFDLDAIIDLTALEAEYDRCETETSLRSPKGDGFYTVGVEIAPGRWESTGTGDGCYWARLTVNQDLIDNHFGIAGGTVTIRASDYEVRFDGCGTWEFVG